MNITHLNYLYTCVVIFNNNWLFPRIFPGFFSHEYQPLCFFYDLHFSFISSVRCACVTHSCSFISCLKPVEMIFSAEPTIRPKVQRVYTYMYIYKTCKTNRYTHIISDYVHVPDIVHLPKISKTVKIHILQFPTCNNVSHYFNAPLF